MKLRGAKGAPLDLVAVGHVTVDRVGSKRRLGGAAAYASLAAARLGLSVGVVTSVGRDFPFWDELSDVELHYRESERTTEFENLYREGARQQRVTALADSLREEDLDALPGRLQNDAAVLYCPVARELELPLVRLAAEGLCAVAPQGFFREWSEAGEVTRGEWAEASSALAQADVVCMSEDDAELGKELAESFPGRAFVLTRGRAGCRLYAGGDVIDFPALAAREVDPTGAGDVFAAALVAALREGHPLRRAVAFASAAGAISVEGEGVEALPTREAIEERLRRAAP